MPIEIRELVIKTAVEDAKPSGQSSANGEKAAGSNHEKIVQDCVERVLEALKEKNER
ncbi:MAG TPA: DUF5908 family protein [Bacteroidia bacterium]|jgi:hypothetical protein|nr:DUF5908 family protein [Bacteroidia bacterium]